MPEHTCCLLVAAFTSTSTSPGLLSLHRTVGLASTARTFSPQHRDCYASRILGPPKCGSSDGGLRLPLDKQAAFLKTGRMQSSAVTADCSCRHGTSACGGRLWTTGVRDVLTSQHPPHTTSQRSSQTSTLSISRLPSSPKSYLLSIRYAPPEPLNPATLRPRCGSNVRCPGE